MMDLLGDIFAFPLVLIELATGAIGFSPEAFRRVAENIDAQSAALTIAFLAGVSEMLGQSVILVVNRVPLYRFLASLAFTGATYLLTALTWTASAVAVAPLTRVGLIEMTNVAALAGIVSLAFAPRLLGFLAIAPYFGAAVSNVLEIWAMCLAVFGLHVAVGLPLPAAAFCGGAGWLVAYLVRSFLGRLLRGPLRRLRILITGSTLERTPQQIIDEVIEAMNTRGGR